MVRASPFLLTIPAVIREVESRTFLLFPVVPFCRILDGVRLG